MNAFNFLYTNFIVQAENSLKSLESAEKNP